VFAAAVVALARVTLGVLVGELGALSLHDRGGDVVFGGDQLDVIFLTAVFCLHGSPEFRVDLGEGVLRGEHGAKSSAVD